ncbi:MAG: hypothetical protein WC569_02295 [Candidatus Omnitrophota bacterium]
MRFPKSELRTRRYLEKLGYYYIRSGRSYGLFDFIALNKEEGILIQAKCNQGPRSAELEALKTFDNYPKGIRKEIWIWKRYHREPMVKIIGGR